MPMRSAQLYRVVRLAASVAFVAALLTVCLRIPHINDATVALLLVLSVVGIATWWGSLEAFLAAIAGGLGFDSYFLPPRGLFIDAPEHMIALAVLLVTAIAAGQLAARARRKQIFAEQRQREMEKLYQLVNTLLDSGAPEGDATEMARKVVTIFGLEGVALYSTQSRQIVRAGPGAGVICDDALQQAAAFGCQIGQPGSALLITPIWHGGELAGSVGINGAGLSPPLLEAIAGRIGLGLARLYAIEKTTQAEVARRSEEMKSAVLDALAHEIRNPLNSVKIAATALLSARIGNELNEREMLTIIDEEVDRMDRFIDEAVQLARMEAKEVSLHKESENLAEIVHGAIDSMGALTSHREISVDVPESLPPADCDKVMMLRVLKQLVNNALKYSPEGSPLTVAAAFTGTALGLDVADRGPGVADDERDRIFEKHYRGHAAAGRAPGTGLGLASAKCIVEAHGGQIWVTNQTGGGAVFHVSLPAAGADHRVETA